MNKKNFIIDLCIFAAFLVMESPNLSGRAIHEWLGLALLGTIMVHVLLHWSWITSIGKSYFKKLWHASRFKFVVDFLMFLAFMTVTMSGIMISETALPAVGINLGQVSMTWRQLHTLAADIVLLMIGLHFALNWGMMVSMFKKYVFSPLGNMFRRKQAVKQPVEVYIDDRR